MNKDTPQFLLSRKEVPVSVIITGLVCLTFLETVALLLGYNGTLLKAVIITIALAIGIVIPGPKLRK